MLVGHLQDSTHFPGQNNIPGMYIFVQIQKPLANAGLKVGNGFELWPVSIRLRNL